MEVGSFIFASILYIIYLFALKAAPIIPASLFKDAISIFVFGLYLLNSFISTNFLIGFKRYSPSLLIPPPITKISGSKIFMTLVIPSATY